MGRKNTSNPHDADPDVFHKQTNMSIQKAKVLDARDMPTENGFHTVKIQVYGDGSPYTAPVITPMPGCVWIPKEDTDVAVIFSESDKPWVIGSWYAVDRVEDGEVFLPDYEPGDIRIGNETESYVTVANNGSIKLETGDLEPINIDHQSASVRMSTDQAIPGDDTYTVVDFDTAQDDPEDLFDPDTSALTVRHAGQHRVEATVEIGAAGQNNRYTVALFADGELVKRKNRQSAINEALSITVATTRRFADDTAIDIRMRQDSGSNKNINSSNVATEFTIERHGI